MTDEQLDVHLDNILKASGSALKHYSMQKTKDDMRQALREALAQPEQEPDKYMMDIECTKCGAKQSGILTVNTTPPQRTWVGLTDEEISSVAYNTNPLDGIRAFSRALEAKLKEKNT